jgi:hypothetical protein
MFFLFHGLKFLKTLSFQVKVSLTRVFKEVQCSRACLACVRFWGSIPGTTEREREREREREEEEEEGERGDRAP